MIVCLGYGFTLLGMPKCASASSREALLPHADLVANRGDLRHTNFRHYEQWVLPFVMRALPEGSPPPEVFCLFRDPLDWLKSWYKFRARPGLAGKPAYTGDIDFSEFVAEVAAPAPRPFARIGSQASFIRDKDRRTDRVHLVRLADLNALLDHFESRIGRQLQRRYVNRSIDARTVVTDDARDLARRHLAEDFAIYDSIAPFAADALPDAPPPHARPARRPGARLPRPPVEPAPSPARPAARGPVAAEASSHPMQIFASPTGGLASRTQCIDACVVLAGRLGAQLTVGWVQNDACAAAFFDLFEEPPGVKVVNFARRPELRQWTEQFAPTRTITAEWILAQTPPPSYWTAAGFPRTQRLHFSQCYLRFVDEPQQRSTLRPEPGLAAIISANAGLAEGAIGVHIRRTDHANAVARSPTQLFITAMEAEPDDRRFFLCTNDPDEETNLRGRFGSRVVTYPKRTLARDDPDGIRDALVDLHLLARTDVIFGSFGSTFTKTAAFLGRRPLRVIAIQGGWGRSASAAADAAALGADNST